MNPLSYRFADDPQDPNPTATVLRGKDEGSSTEISNQQSNFDFKFRERALLMDARKLSVETLVRVHLESVGGTRLLVLSHQRLMFTLSLGTLAGVITLFASALRLQGPQMQTLPPVQAVLALLALATLTIAALLSAATLQQATQQASRLLREPFPGANADLAKIFSPETRDESAIVASVLSVLERRVQAEPVVAPAMWGSTALLLAGITATAAAFAF